MIKNSQRQNGSAHIAIAIILVVAVIGLLSFVFWQNFIKSDDTQQTAKNTSETTLDQENRNIDSRSYSNKVIGIKLDYTKDWVKLECNTADVENAQNIVYFGTNNYGVGVVDANESNLCGGGTDFPPQAAIARVNTVGEFAGTYIDVAIDGKNAKKYTSVSDPDSILPGLEMTRYVVDMDNDQFIIFSYNRFPGIEGDKRDNSEASLQSFTKLVEENIHFL